MNEILLVAVVIIVLVGTHLLVRKLGQKAKLYTKICCVGLLLLLIWLTYRNDHLPFRIILTVLSISSLYKEFSSLKNADLKKS